MSVRPRQSADPDGGKPGSPSMVKSAARWAGTLLTGLLFLQCASGDGGPDGGECPDGGGRLDGGCPAGSISFSCRRDVSPPINCHTYSFPDEGAAPRDCGGVGGWPAPACYKGATGGCMFSITVFGVTGSDTAWHFGGTVEGVKIFCAQRGGLFVATPASL